MYCNFDNINNETIDFFTYSYMRDQSAQCFGPIFGGPFICKIAITNNPIYRIMCISFAIAKFVILRMSYRETPQTFIYVRPSVCLTGWSVLIFLLIVLQVLVSPPRIMRIWIIRLNIVYTFSFRRHRYYDQNL